MSDIAIAEGDPYTICIVQPDNLIEAIGPIKVTR